MTFDFWPCFACAIFIFYTHRVYRKFNGKPRPCIVKLVEISPTRRPKTVVVDSLFNVRTTDQGECVLFKICGHISLSQLVWEFERTGLLPGTASDLAAVSDHLDNMGQVISPATTVNGSGKVALPVLVEVNGTGHIFPDYKHGEVGDITFHPGELVLARKPVP